MNWSSMPPTYRMGFLWGWNHLSVCKSTWQAPKICRLSLLLLILSSYPRFSERKSTSQAWVRIKRDDVRSNHNGWHLVGAQQNRHGMTWLVRPRGILQGLLGSLGGRDLWENTNASCSCVLLVCHPRLPSRNTLQSRVWSGLFSALSLHPELH